jgi:hypothetical protein
MIAMYEDVSRSGKRLYNQAACITGDMCEVSFANGNLEAGELREVGISLFRSSMELLLITVYFTT